MATQIRRGPQTTVSVIGGTRTVARSPGLPPMVRSKPHVEAVKEPSVLARILMEIHRELDALRQADASVLAGAVYLVSIPLIAGTTYVEHRLSRTPVGVFPSMTTGAVFLAALPANMDSTRYFAVASAIVQNASFLVF